MGLLTRIFGNGEDTPADAADGSDASVESQDQGEPGDRASSQMPGDATDVTSTETAAVPSPEAPAASNGRASRRSGQALDPAPSRRSIPASGAPRTLHAGGNASDVASSAALNSATPGRPEADDPEEIDVSDQLDAWDAVDTTGDLDATEDLIVEDPEDMPSASVSTRGNDAGSATASLTDGVPPPGPGEPSSLPAAQDRRVGELAPRARDLAARPPPPLPRETPPKPDPERMRMPTEIKPPKQTLVEAGTEFKGTLKSSCPVVINGSIDGEIEAPTLSIASTGAMLGSVKVKTLRSQGTLSGNVDADEVFLSGAVRSKTVIKAKRLEVKIGSVSKGQLEVTFGNCDIDMSDVSSEPAPSGALLASADSDNDSSSNGWESADLSSGSLLPAVAASSGRSTSKSSRRNEGPGSS